MVVNASGTIVDRARRILRHVQDAVEEDDEVVHVWIACGGGEDAVRCGIGLVDCAGERLSRGGSQLRCSVGPPVSGQFLTGGVDDASVHRIAEIDDVELGNGVSGYDRAAVRIRNGERENGAEQGFYFEQRRDGVGCEVE